MKKIILDTDLGADCDDAGALALLHTCANAGKCELTALTLGTANPWAAHCAKVINAYYRREIPIAQTDVLPPGEDTAYFPHSYAKHIAERFPLPAPVQTELPVPLMRRTLAGCGKGEVVLVVIGGCNNLAALLLSPPDEISPLTGEQLVREKVAGVSLMGCFFPTAEVPEVWQGGKKMEAEWNILQDIPSAQTVFTRCPVPIAITQYTVGNAIHTGGVLIEQQRENPVAECYFVHSNGNRASWDPVTAYFAVFGQDGYFSAGERGAVTIDQRGVSTFRPCKEGRHFVLECKNPAAAEKRIDEVLLGKFY